MANLKEIRRRIASVKGTQKITRAMKMVAAARLRRAQESAESFRSYADLTSSVLAEVAAGATADDHPLLERRENNRAIVLVISADRGLCGGFNGNLNRTVGEHEEMSAPRPELAIAGKKAMAYFERRSVTICDSFPDVFDELNYETAAVIARKLAKMYRAGEVDRIEIAFNKMLSMISQKPTIRQLLPVALPEQTGEQEESHGPAGFIFEPDRKKLLGRLLPMYVEVEIYRALLESVAAEQAARMTAMETATNNAQDMIDHLTLVYNRARQSAITNELMDIVGGAEALNE